MRLGLWLWLLVCLTRCSAPPAREDAGDDASVWVDDGGDDAGLADAGAPDAGTPDSGVDAGVGHGREQLVPGPATPVRDAQGCELPYGQGAPFRVRAVAANLSSGNLQSYDPGEGQRILAGIDPDVVMIQEFNYGGDTPADFDTFVAATFDGGFHWARGSGQIPNGVLSRWRIVAQGEWTDPQVSNRTFVWAKVSPPGVRDLWVVSLHLLTSSAANRDAEARALVSFLNANVPRGDLVLIGGDFNTGSRSEQAISTLGARVLTTGPQPVDQQGNGNTNASRAQPYDWVLASPCLDRLEVPVRIGAAQYDAGLVVDTRVYSPLSDLAPAQFGDSAATAMQHMAVVRDFQLQP